MTGNGGVHVYVYYRVRSTDAPSVVATVREMQASLSATLPGLHCAVAQRVEQGVDLVTLMETYAHASGLSETWRCEMETHALALLSLWTVGPRHVEVFEPCA